MSNEKPVEEMIRELSLRIKAPSDFDHYPALTRLMRDTFHPATSTTNSKRLAYLALIVVPIIAVLISLSSSSGRCLWRTPAIVRDLWLKRAVNCDVCSNVSTVDRVANIVNKDEFMRKYTRRGKPVVVTDATKDWSAMQSFSLNFFRSVYRNKTRPYCQFFPYTSKFRSLQRTLEWASRTTNVEPWYIGWSNCDKEIAELFGHYYDRPYFLPDSSESPGVDWIFMGSPGHGAELHVDFVYYPSWQAQIRGTKKWMLHPPPECYYSCPQRFLEVILQPGDMLLVNTNLWYHKTIVMGDELSISIGSEFD